MMTENHGMDVRDAFAGGGWRYRKLACLLTGLLVPVAFTTAARAQDEVVALANCAEATAEATVFDELADRQEALFAVIITDAGLVRYDVLAEVEYRAELQALVQRYAELPIPEIKKKADTEAGGAESADHAERLVFLINAYNLNVLEQVMATGVPKKVLDVEGFFDQREITVGGVVLTLNSLENSYVRTLGDPRIHAALNCAALSCPALGRKAFRAQTLDIYLDDLCRRWVNDAARNSVTESGALEVSQIFNWFAGDFAVVPFKDRIGFLKHFANSRSTLGRALQKVAANAADDGLGFQEYDWQLNAAALANAATDK